MRGNKLFRLTVAACYWALCPTLSVASHTSVEVRFDEPLSGKVTHFEIQGLLNTARAVRGLESEPALLWLNAVVPAEWGPDLRLGLHVIEAETLAVLDRIPDLSADQHTDGEHRLGSQKESWTVIRDAWYPSVSVKSAGSGFVHSQPVTSLAWCPFRYNPALGTLIVIRRALVTIVGTDGVAPSPVDGEPLPALPNINDLALARLRSTPPRLTPPPVTPGLISPPSWSLPADPPLGVEYILITGAAYREVVMPLVHWKAVRGVDAGIASVEAIKASYPGIDAAESIREYLKAAYAAGAQWVLLAGDETVVPTRYAYAGYQAAPSDAYNLHICDLYYAELDGNWDADGDGIYGEYFGDAGELYGELFVGRLPFSDPVEAAIIVDKIIRYEQGPSDGSYLSRALSVASDQMRDWDNGVGQQTIVAGSMPTGWAHDSQTMIEQPSGDSPSPYSPEPTSLPSLIASGFGWVNYFVHGRADGVIVRAPGYTNIPQSYVWTYGSSGDGHGHFNEMPPHQFPGIHLSIGCDHGGFDMDTPPFAPGYHESVAERLLFTPDGGAVAFVGQSRWGWVATSYKLIQTFYDLLNDPGVANHLGVYQSLAKVAFPQYRDINYSNNLYGDPETPAWKDVPREWSVTGPTTFGGYDDAWVVEAIGGSGPVEGAVATVAIGDSVWIIGTTDGSGKVAASLNLPPAWDAVLTVWKEGFRAYVDTVPYTIITDIKDGNNDALAPVQGLSNFPNPFNPSTRLRFALGRPGAVRLDVFDVLGRHVATLLDESLDSGDFEIEFDGRDAGGHSLASGMYFARLQSADGTRTRAMVLLR